MSEPDTPYAQASVEVVALLATNYFLALVAKGMTRKEALRLTIAWVKVLTRNARMQ